MKQQVDRQLLLGLLALQCGFISKDQLVAAFGVWMSDKERSLDGILQSSKALSAQQQALLSALVVEHLKQHDNDPEQSLAALSSVRSVKSALAGLNDPELVATLQSLKPDSDDIYPTLTVPSPGATSNRFIVLCPHARGGLGMVSIAMDNELNRRVAFKEILPERADNLDNQSRFIQEAEITGQLEHPGIVPIYGLGNYADGRPYYAMRFVDGQNLRTAIADFHKERGVHQRLEGAMAIAFRSLLGRFIDVCHAIEYAHSRSVLHRDLKPDNILIGPYGETLVVDWGLAKVLNNESVSQAGSDRHVNLRSGSNATMDGSTIGTPAYMPPEQAMGRINDLGPAADIYSLGATLYSLLTGKPPVEGADVFQVLEKVRIGDIREPRYHWAVVPKAVEMVCRKAMSLEPKDRYSSARALADDLERWLADEPVSAWQENYATRIGRLARRHRAWIMALFVLLALASGIATFSAIIINRFRLKEQALRSVVQEMARESRLAEARSRFSELEQLKASQPDAVELRKQEKKRQVALLDIRLTQALDAETVAWLHMRKGELIKAMSMRDKIEMEAARREFASAADIFRATLKKERSTNNIESLLASLRNLAEVDDSLENDALKKQTIQEALSHIQDEIRNKQTESSWELWLSHFKALSEESPFDFLGSTKKPPSESERDIDWQTECTSMEVLAKLPWPNDSIGSELRTESIRSSLRLFASRQRPTDPTLIRRAAKTGVALIEQVFANADINDSDVAIELFLLLQKSIAELDDAQAVDQLLNFQKSLMERSFFQNLKIESHKNLLDSFNSGVSAAWQNNLRPQALEICRLAVEKAHRANEKAGSDTGFAVAEFDQLIRFADLLEESEQLKELTSTAERIVALGEILQGRGGLSKVRLNQWVRHRDRIRNNPNSADDPFKL